MIVSTIYYNISHKNLPFPHTTKVGGSLAVLLWQETRKYLQVVRRKSDIFFSKEEAVHNKMAYRKYAITLFDYNSWFCAFMHSDSSSQVSCMEKPENEKYESDHYALDQPYLYFLFCSSDFCHAWRKLWIRFVYRFCDLWDSGNSNVYIMY